MYPPHESAEIPLDMAAKLGTSRRAILQTDTVAFATTLERQAVKLGGVVQMHDLWNAVRSPSDLEPLPLQPAILRQARHGERKADRGRGRRVQAQNKPEHHPGRNIKRDCNPRSPHRLALHLIDNHDVDERVVDLDNIERINSARRAHCTGRYVDISAIPQSADAPVPQTGDHCATTRGR